MNLLFRIYRGRVKKKRKEIKIWRQEQERVREWMNIITVMIFQNIFESLFSISLHTEAGKKQADVKDEKTKI